MAAMRVWPLSCWAPSTSPSGCRPSGCMTTPTAGWWGELSSTLLADQFLLRSTSRTSRTNHSGTFLGKKKTISGLTELEKLLHTSSILFWTTQQKQLLDSLEQERNTLILGDYGTGKTLLLMAVAEQMMKAGRDVVYINALDYLDLDQEKYYKTWEDVLDVIVKRKFGDAMKVLDVGTLRRDYIEKKLCKYTKLLDQMPSSQVAFSFFPVPEINTVSESNVSTLELINDYISNLSNSKDTMVSKIESIKIG